MTATENTTTATAIPTIWEVAAVRARAAVAQQKMSTTHVNAIAMPLELGVMIARKTSGMIEM